MTCWASQAADDHADAESQAEARAEFVERFTTDACDEMLCTEGEAVELIRDNAALETLFLKVLWADPKNAFSLIVELRDALRTKVQQAYPHGVAAAAERLADEFIREAA
jgi:hypothetical protein